MEVFWSWVRNKKGNKKKIIAKEPDFISNPCAFDNILNGSGNPVITIDEEGTLVAPGGVFLRGVECYRVMDLPHRIGYPAW